jgi:hypothetical protein
MGAAGLSGSVTSPDCSGGCLSHSAWRCKGRYPTRTHGSAGGQANGLLAES